MFTFAEMTDMHLVFGEARCNTRLAERIYRERFPNRRHPCRKTFAAIDRRLRELGTMTVNRLDTGARRLVRTVDFEEDILKRFENEPSTSTRAIGHAMGVAHNTVWKVVHEQQLHPYHLQKVQAMGPADFPLRVNFCQWYLNRLVDNPHFGSMVLFSDEAQFTKDGLFNSRNSHLWNDENPHAKHIRTHQQRFSVNIWAAILGDQLIGPFVLPPRLNGNNYLQFLRETLPELIEDVMLFVRNQMWYQHDGAPAHFSRAVRDYLDQTYPGRWIGKGGPVAWPPRSPDLTSLDFFLWGHVKSLVYATPVETVEDLTARIFNACEVVQHTPGIFERVRQSMVRRCNACIELGSRHFEHLL
jgi:hypothetical protein